MEDSKELLRFRGFIDFILDNYALTDQLLNVPEPFTDQSLDLRQQFEDAFDADYDTLYEFYCAIRDVFASARDIHFQFHPPCTSMFYYLWPYSLRLAHNGTVSDDGKSFDVRFFPNPLKSMTKWYYNLTGDYPHLLGKKLLHIRFPEIDDIPDEPPALTISRLADHYVTFMNTPAAKLNYALTNLIPIRHLSSFPEPEPITVTYELDNCTNNNSTNSATSPCSHTTDVPYFLHVDSNVSLPDLCNLHLSFNTFKPTTTGFSYSGIGDTIGFLDYGGDHDVEDLIDRSYEEDLFGMGNGPDLEVVDNTPISRYGYFPETGEWRLMPTAPSDIPSTRELSYHSTLLDLPSESDTSRIPTTNIALIANLSHISSYHVPDLETVILDIRSFYLYRNETKEEFSKVLIRTIQFAKLPTIKHFIISLHCNPGGQIDLVDLFTHLFWPNLSYTIPSSLVVDELNQAYLSSYSRNNNAAMHYPTIDGN